VQVDKARAVIPISGTQVRENPLGCWEYLEPPVRGYYARRVCVVGAESTGKTILARRLAEHYETVWVAESGREACERMLAEIGEYQWRSEDFMEIARIQCKRENEAARRANRILICDTDAFATSIWHRRYMGERSPEVEAIAESHRRPDLYLISNVDTPFVQDGTRDGEGIREWMHGVFVEELVRTDRPFRILTGDWEERFRQAVGHIDALIGDSINA
jgi:NadR type nicotinamide-nucleotide adenylyltransferase